MYHDYSKCFMYYYLIFPIQPVLLIPITQEETEAVSESVISPEPHSGRAVVRMKQSGSQGFYLPRTRAVHSISGLFWFRQIYLLCNVNPLVEFN